MKVNRRFNLARKNQARSYALDYPTPRMFPVSCDTFVALPPSTAGQRIVFGKNSDRPSDEVQEVVYIPAKDHQTKKVECTYIEVDQVPHTYAVVLSRPAWLWGAEMGANEHQVCIGNEAVLALERADSADRAVGVITELLERYGQGGNCMEDKCGFTYHNSFLISDRREAWVLETAGKFWAAERVEGGYRNISNQYSITTRIDREHEGLRAYARERRWWNGDAPFSFSDILRDKASGINMEGAFMSTGSMVSVVPEDESLPGVHFFTATPDPARSVFKPFVFVADVEPLTLTSSPCFGDDDPVKRKPRFQSKPNRKHPLFLKHEVTAALIDSNDERGKQLQQKMRDLEKQKMEEMEKYLSEGMEDTTLLVHLFTNSVQEEMSIHSRP
ncbi:hypothetical protein DNTS_031284 [Danionella cerebrum]|uniref:Secernin-3 n=1 Tax=Danionella cerebrum TaxID=2873325 RepID=A0A553Q5W8_9TELE|nr:hypothetical protein DNTS_031284 [Danionella translucida]